MAVRETVAKWAADGHLSREAAEGDAAKKPGGGRVVVVGVDGRTTGRTTGHTQ